MSFGPPKPFRTWPTVASPQAQKRLDDDAEMIMWLMGLPRRKKPEEGEDKTPEGIWERPPQAPKVPGHAAYPGLFQGLLYRPPGARELLDLDPHDPLPRPMPASGLAAPAPAWPAPGASSGAAQFANTLRLAAETDLRPATLSLSNPGSLPPKPVSQPQPQPQPQPYMEGGAAGGADWRDVFSPSALDKPPSPFGEAARGILDPQRGQPLFNPLPARQEMPEFRAPPVPAPTMPRSQAPEGTGMDRPAPAAAGKTNGPPFDEQARNVIRNTMRLEGGLADIPGDPGGLTNHGISYEKSGKQLGLSKQDIENLTPEQAEKIYFDNFYKKYGIGRLPAELQPQVFDHVISSGSDGTGLTAFKDFQGALNDLGYTDAEGKKLDEDGILGSRTVQTARKVPQEKIVEFSNAYATRRADNYSKWIGEQSEVREPLRRGLMKRVWSFVPQNR
jgi:hypothetical protein